MNRLFEYALQNLSNSVIVGITIQNQVNQNDKPIGNSFRMTDQLYEGVLWSFFERVFQSNARFDASDSLS